MLRRLLSLILLAWALGFVWFAVVLPQPAGTERSDAVVVLTGAAGRVERGLAVLDNHWAPRMFVSGVYREVKSGEFAAQFHVSSTQMACCVMLGYSATDTVSNARETAEWVRKQRVQSIRLVTSDWHMRRAAGELRSELPDGVAVIEDAVATKPSWRTLFVEYHKLVARFIARLAEL
ncbi:YdcF family protein [Novosphingobium sp.]|uniref:YdcF family protein n=1 Tax=Novosphingobium sp. TaxID=1874826 RepID=UPI0025DAC37D|nr:YdcF family protein [Novosphingobium sp.]MCC6924633.1 YdcF family protein [Novosphingobium sp.]